MTKWSPRLIADRMEEAVSTLRRLPPVTVQGYFNLWPAIKYTEREIWEMEKLPMRLGPPSAQAISRMEETLEWITWLDEVDERRLIWLRASKVRWKVICARIGTDRSTAWRYWVIALTKIATRLNGTGKTCNQNAEESVD
jgi:hypothetical protein